MYIKPEHIDIHCHVIPGVDDGAPYFPEAIMMLKRLAMQGVETVFATPHSWAIYDAAESSEMRERFWFLQDEIALRKIPISLYLGCEMAVSAKTLDRCLDYVRSGIYPTMNGTKYILTELPQLCLFDEASKCVKGIVSAGYTPIIAHAERYVFADEFTIRDLKAIGALVQINAYSILNEANESVRRAANALLRHKLVDFIGSDAHGISHRPPKVSDGIDAIVQMCGAEYAEQILNVNPKKLLETGESVY